MQVLKMFDSGVFARLSKLGLRPERRRGHSGNTVDCLCSAVYWADILRRFVRFSLSEVTELCEAQLLWLKTVQANIKSLMYCH